MHAPVLALLALWLGLACVSAFAPSCSRVGSGPLGARFFSHLNAKYKVSIKNEGQRKTIEVDEGESILEAALDAGLDLPHDCKTGACLRCSAKIIEGTVDQTGTTLGESVVEQGFALTCMTFPRSDVRIDCVDEDELMDAQFAGRA
jgi:ferredoxin